MKRLFFDDEDFVFVNRLISGPHICGEGLDIDPVHNHILTGSWRKYDVLQVCRSIFFLSSIYMSLCWYIVLILFSYILKILNGKDSDMGLYLIIKNCPGKSFCIRKNPRLTNEDNMML